jgi:transcription initiation factor TFIID TATA-box-binding protein
MEIVNIVAIAEVNEPFDLLLISEKIKNSEFASGGGKWLKMRLKPENYYTAFYKSGKFLITGVRSNDKLNEIVQRILNLLKNVGINAELKTVKIHNIVLMDKVNLNKSLNDLIVALDDKRALYEPEQFPGLMYKDERVGISYLLFPSGKVVITGVKDIKIAKKEYEEFKTLIETLGN